ncbi:hypothetical protein H4S07_000329 [Coemansia furcata]|uniref:Uncharacterized protein n=1 Tax=Coemansia furcata TaxID=417177 RepID=A0ACC1LQH0_9FUNG|nr:hypothetical protein H4S07_000329 [Coemansia furcata]
MSLFRDLPPIESKDGAGEGGSGSQGPAQAGHEPAKTGAAWVRPEFAPNLRRHRVAKPAVRRPALAAFSERDDNSNEGKAAEERDRSSLAPSSASTVSVVKPPVPLLNPKHPHSTPQRPDLLISKWEAIAMAGERPLEKPSGLGGRPAAPSLSLAEYMPMPLRPRGKHSSKRVTGTGFEPFAEYCPAAPNNYQQYKDWSAREKKLRTEHHAHISKNSVNDDDDEDEYEDDGDEFDHERKSECGVTGELRRDPGIPSTRIALTNMADVVDDELELETREECAAFGEVIRCTVSSIDDSEDLLSPFERVRVLVEFADLASATRAQEALDQRFFDGRHISAVFVRPED